MANFDGIMKEYIGGQWIVRPFYTNISGFKTAPVYARVGGAWKLIQTLLAPAGGSTLLDGLISFWKFNEPVGTGTVDDATTNANDGTTSGTQSNAGGKVGGSVTIASAQSISIPWSSTLVAGTTGFTVSMWVNFSTLPSVHGHQAVLFSMNPRMQFTVTPSNELGSDVWDSASAEYYSGSYAAEITSASTWYHLLFSWAGTGNAVLFYKNNILVDTRDLEQVVTGTIKVPTVGEMPTCFMGAAYDGDTDNHMIGQMDAVGLWNRPLTSGERIENYNSFNGVEHPFS